MKDRSLIARFRCENETKGGQYWKQEEKRKCRCEETKSEMRAKEFIGEEGKGLEIMKKIEKARREAQERERENKNEDSSLLEAQE
ncbi:hypothetical protein ALC62_01731 [Cyphomyrmex costatus]|uniref:Uncharacterized protein n=1 Tax=Cyphomyrmex costatus TaxID=456900 RepID=A0A195D525_9HYME|nr:hypothetical protein ALC62_01731 [Cyphomyrmex costatus]